MKKTVAVITVIGLITSGLTAFYWAPIESSMGFVQKIMYIHVPSAWTGFLAITVAFVFSVLYLWKRLERFDVIAACSVEIGVMFCGFALLTGSLWARPTWNTYWTWDARLTTTLILFLIFVGYLLLRKLTDFGEQQARLSAVVAIIGFLDIPLIHMSVVWWRTLHQPSTVFSSREGVIDDRIYVTLIMSVVTFTFMYAFLLISRIDLEWRKRKYHKTTASLQ